MPAKPRFHVDDLHTDSNSIQTKRSEMPWKRSGCGGERGHGRGRRRGQGGSEKGCEEYRDRKEYEEGDKGTI